MRRKGSSPEMLVQPLWKIVWRLLEKSTQQNCNSGYFSKKPLKTLLQKDICTPMFIAALFTIAKKWKQPQCPSTDE